jgi:hypothetical protein
MSLGIDKLDVAVARDPRTNFADDKQMYLIEKPGEDVTQRKIISTTSNDSNLNWSAPPPSPSVIVDRKIYAKVKYRLTFTLDDAVEANRNTFAADVKRKDGNAVAGRSGPRAYPLARSSNNLRITINNNSVSTELSDYFHALVRYNTGRDMRQYDYSCTPHQLDAFQHYDDAAGSALSPFASYGDNTYEDSRACFTGLTLISDNTVGNVRTIVQDLEVTELLYLNPLLFDKHSNQKGFIGVQTFDVVINLESDLASAIWCNNYQPVGNNYDVTATIEGNPELLFTYITPNLLDMPKISDSIIYPYYNIDRYNTPVSAIIPAIAGDPNANPGTVEVISSLDVTSNNIQLNSIPKRIYIFARRRNNSRSVFTTDTFARINSISFNWNNRNGLLSSANSEQLYQISVKNGLNMSWDEWNRNAGSVLCLDFAKDIGLSSMEAPGLLGTYQMNYRVNISNMNRINAINFDLYTIVVSAGTFTISSNRANSQIGVISKQDILDAPDLPLVQYDYDMDGGNFFSGLKKTGRFLKKAAKKVAPVVRKYGPAAADALGIVSPRASKALKEVGKAVDPLAKLVGLGYDEEQAMDMMEAMGYVGGSYLNGKGGKMANKNKLRGRAIGY